MLFNYIFLKIKLHIVKGKLEIKKILTPFLVIQIHHLVWFRKKIKKI